MGGNERMRERERERERDVVKGVIRGGIACTSACARLRAVNQKSADLESNSHAHAPDHIVFERAQQRQPEEMETVLQKRGFLHALILLLQEAWSRRLFAI